MAKRTNSSRKSSGKSKTTTDHDEIREWAEARGGKPSCVKGTGGRGDAGVLRIDFPGYSGEDSLHEISWDEFFEKFDEQKLSLVYQEETSGGQESRFNKLVSRTNARRKTARRPGASAGRGKAKSASKRAAKSAPKRTPARASASRKSATSKGRGRATSARGKGR